MTTLDHVADVEAAARPAAKSSDTKAAIAYLIASGATAITIIENETGCAYRVGTRIDPRAAVVHWIAGANATAVMRKARKIAGRSPDIATATAALHQAAADLKVTLTPHASAMREFTKTFKRRRLAAGLRGEGFMSYGNAELRLRRALIPLLQGGNVATASLFADVFDR